MATLSARVIERPVGGNTRMHMVELLGIMKSFGTVYCE